MSGTGNAYRVFPQLGKNIPEYSPQNETDINNLKFRFFHQFETLFIKRPSQEVLDNQKLSTLFHEKVFPCIFNTLQKIKLHLGVYISFFCLFVKAELALISSKYPNMF